MTAPSGISRTSSRITSIRGCELSMLVTNCANSPRSTARAPPAGNAVRSAHSISKEPKIRSSSLRSPEARSTMLEPSELEHTNSARSAVVCAPVLNPGRISNNFTAIPRWAACQAASLPESPPPIIINFWDIPK